MFVYKYGRQSRNGVSVHREVYVHLNYFCPKTTLVRSILCASEVPGYTMSPSDSCPASRLTVNPGRMMIIAARERSERNVSCSSEVHHDGFR